MTTVARPDRFRGPNDDLFSGARTGELKGAVHWPDHGMVGIELRLVHPKSSEGRTVLLYLDDRDAREILTEILRPFLAANRATPEGGRR
jgi:hypothetical protein